MACFLVLLKMNDNKILVICAEKIVHRKIKKFFEFFNNITFIASKCV
jgi:hypothetical protein